MQCTWIIPKPSTPTQEVGKLSTRSVPQLLKRLGTAVLGEATSHIEEGVSELLEAQEKHRVSRLSLWMVDHTEIVSVHWVLCAKQRELMVWSFRNILILGILKTTATTALDFSSSAWWEKGNIGRVWFFGFFDSLKPCWFGGRGLHWEMVFPHRRCAPVSWQLLLGHEKEEIIQEKDEQNYRLFWSEFSGASSFKTFYFQSLFFSPILRYDWPN